MDENERKLLIEKYMQLTEEELKELLIKPESNYREGVYPVMFEVAISRGIYTNKDEINEMVEKSITIQSETDIKVAEQTLSSLQRKLFTIFPGVALWYFFLAPQGWNQRIMEAKRCQLIGTRIYLIIFIVLLGIIFLVNPPISLGEIIFILLLFVLVCMITAYLHYQDNKSN